VCIYIYIGLTHT